MDKIVPKLVKFNKIYTSKPPKLLKILHFLSKFTSHRRVRTQNFWPYRGFWDETLQTEFEAWLPKIHKITGVLHNNLTFFVEIPSLGALVQNGVNSGHIPQVGTIRKNGP